MFKLDVNVWLHSHCLEFGTVKVLTASAGCATQSLVSHSAALLGGFASNRTSSLEYLKCLEESSNDEPCQSTRIIVIPVYSLWLHQR